MRHSAPGRHKDMDKLTKGHVYALIICVTLIIVTIIGTFGR
jgi:hypothetical protein